METIKFIVKCLGDGLNEELHVVCPRDIVSIFELIKHVYTEITVSGFKKAYLTTDGAYIQITSDNWFYFEMFGIEMFGAQGRLTFTGKLSEL